MAEPSSLDVSSLDVFEYAVIRVVPRVDRAEFLNAGVVLWCRPQEHLAARTALDPRRLQSFASDLDVPAVTRHLTALEAVCAGESGAAASEGKGARFRWLVAPRSTVLQTSPVHCGLTADPVAELERLLARYVTTR